MCCLLLYLMAKQYRLAQYGSFNITNIAKYSSRKQKIAPKNIQISLCLKRWMVVVLTQILWKHMAVVSSDERDTIAGEQYCHQLKMYQLVKPLKESTKKRRKLATKLVKIPRKCNNKIMVFPATVTMGALNVRPRTNLAPLQDLVFIRSFRQVGATKYIIYDILYNWAGRWGPQNM